MLRAYSIGCSLANPNTKDLIVAKIPVKRRSSLIGYLIISHQLNPKTVFKYSPDQENNFATKLSGAFS